MRRCRFFKERNEYLGNRPSGNSFKEKAAAAKPENLREFYFCTARRHCNRME